MGVDYREQYRREHLEPFWPNEFLKMSVSVLCTLAIIMLLIILPVALDAVGLHQVIHAEEPADPHGSTPIGIKPEWYFLASYQFLRMMPTELLSISGKTLGVVIQGVAVTLLALLPFLYRRRAHQRPRPVYRLAITAAIIVVLLLTAWGGWPEAHDGSHGQLVPLAEYMGHQPLLFIMTAAAIIVFFALVGHERRTIRRTLDGPASLPPKERAP